MQKTGEEIVAAAIARRTTQGLKLVFAIPPCNGAPATDFTCYPRDEAQKARWLESGARNGWTVKSC